MSYEYDDLERRLLELLDLTGPVLTPEEAQDVRMFIDAGEYGVALETFCQVLQETGKTVSGAAADSLTSLAHDMALEPAFLHNVRSGPV